MSKDKTSGVPPAQPVPITYPENRDFNPKAGGKTVRGKYETRTVKVRRGGKVVTKKVLKNPKRKMARGFKAADYHGLQGTGGVGSPTGAERDRMLMEIISPQKPKSGVKRPQKRTR